MLAVCVALSGCGGKNKSSEDDSYHSQGNENGKLNFVNGTVGYSFPEFLENTDKLDRFGRLIYDSFDKRPAEVTDETETPEGYYCDQSYLDGKLFRFWNGSQCGLTDQTGSVILEDNYSSVEMVRSDLFRLTGTDGSISLAKVDASGNVTLADDGSCDWVFQKNQLSIEQIAVNEQENGQDKPEGTKYALVTPDKANVYNTYFDSIAVFPEDKLDVDCEYSFSAHAGGSYFIILFDKYYNYTVYEGSYGSVEVSVDGKKGACDVFSHDHFMQLSSLTASFSYTSSEEVPDKEGDYVLVTFGSDENVTAYAKFFNDGYCEITSFTEGNTGKAEYKVSAEAFADLVDWVDKMLSSEFEDEKQEQ